MSRSLLHDWESSIENLFGEMSKIAEDIYNTAYTRGKNHSDVAEVLDKIRAEIQNLRDCSCSCSDGIIDDVEGLLNGAQSLLSAKPQPKMGRWTYIQYDGNPRIGNWKCSLCMKNVMFGQNQNDKPLYNYCPNCGAKMRKVRNK